MGRTGSLAIVAAGALFLVVCGSESSSSSDEVAALQAQVDELTEENAQLKELLDDSSTAETAEAPETEPETTEPADTEVPAETEPPATDPPTTEAVVSLLSFNGVDPASFPDATPGEITIVSVLDPSGRDSGLLVLRNGTEQTLTGFEVSVTGRDPAGTLVATGWTKVRRANPHRPGPVGNRIGLYGCRRLPPDTSFEYEIVDVQSDTEFIGGVSVPIVETSSAGMDVLGLVENSTEDEVSGPISILYVCLGSDTEITATQGPSVTRTLLRPAGRPHSNRRSIAGVVRQIDLGRIRLQLLVPPNQLT